MLWLLWVQHTLCSFHLKITANQKVFLLSRIRGMLFDERSIMRAWSVQIHVMCNIQSFWTVVSLLHELSVSEERDMTPMLTKGKQKAVFNPRIPLSAQDGVSLPLSCWTLGQMLLQPINSPECHALHVMYVLCVCVGVQSHPSELKAFVLFVFSPLQCFLYRVVVWPLCPFTT